jgi:DNA invertase Pin-like site-specific DNA recombinase
MTETHAQNQGDTMLIADQINKQEWADYLTEAQFRSLAEPWADTGTSTGRLMIAVLGGLADVDRDLIGTRTAEARSRAKARGQQMGRPPALTPAQQKEATRRARRALRSTNWRAATA